MEMVFQIHSNIWGTPHYFRRFDLYLVGIWPRAKFISIYDQPTLVSIIPYLVGNYLDRHANLDGRVVHTRQLGLFARA
jgi:hypothetical protein